MSRLRYSTICLAVACCVSLLATASAWAAEGETRYFVEGSEVSTPETFDAVMGPVQVNTEIGGVKQIVECTTNSISGALEEEGAVTSSVTLNDCSLYEVSKGKKSVSETCEAERSQRLRLVERSRIRGIIFLRLRVRLTLTEVLRSRTGKTCLTAGTYEIEGSITGAFSPDSIVEGTEHSIVFTSSESELTLSGQPAPATTFTISRMKLLSGRRWRLF